MCCELVRAAPFYASLDSPKVTVPLGAGFGKVGYLIGNHPASRSARAHMDERTCPISLEKSNPELLKLGDSRLMPRVGFFFSLFRAIDHRSSLLHMEEVDKANLRHNKPLFRIWIDAVLKAGACTRLLVDFSLSLYCLGNFRELMNLWQLLSGEFYCQITEKSVTPTRIRRLRCCENFMKFEDKIQCLGPACGKWQG